MALLRNRHTILRSLLIDATPQRFYEFILWTLRFNSYRNKRMWTNLYRRKFWSCCIATPNLLKDFRDLFETWVHRLKESCHTHEWVMLHVQMSYVACMNERYDALAWVKSHEWAIWQAWMSQTSNIKHQTYRHINILTYRHLEWV